MLWGGEIFPFEIPPLGPSEESAVSLALRQLAMEGNDCTNDIVSMHLIFSFPILALSYQGREDTAMKATKGTYRHTWDPAVQVCTE